jgi:hypothetical protein
LYVFLACRSIDREVIAPLAELRLLTGWKSVKVLERVAELKDAKLVEEWVSDDGPSLYRMDMDP